MGGSIQASSTPGEGSSFRFAISLPFEAGTELAAEFPPQTVMLIHRHEGLRDSAVNTLQALGLQVISASGIGTARAMLYQHGDVTPSLLIAELPDNTSVSQQLTTLRRLVPGRVPDILLIEPHYSSSAAESHTEVTSAEQTAVRGATVPGTTKRTASLCQH